MKVEVSDRLKKEAKKENRSVSNFVDSLLLKHFKELDNGTVTKIEL